MYRCFPQIFLPSLGRNRRGAYCGAYALENIYHAVIADCAWAFGDLITIVSFIPNLSSGACEFIRTQTGKNGESTNGAASSKNKGRTKDNRAVEVTQEDNHLYIRSSEVKRVSRKMYLIWKNS
jgi:hypothetical protein